jgi:hypothetical protein
MSARITATIIASGEPITVKLDTAARGPAGSAGPNSVTSATTSDGTANLSVATISSQGATLVNPEFDNGIIADDNGGYSRLRVGNIIMSSAEGSIDCGQVDAATVNATTLRVSSTEYLSGASFTYGNATALRNHAIALATPIVAAHTTTTKTLAGEDLETFIPFSNAAGCEITIPTGLGIGAETIYLHREPTAGALTLSHAGVTVDNAAAIDDVDAGGTCALKRRAVNHWVLI